MILRAIQQIELFKLLRDFLKVNKFKLIRILFLVTLNSMVYLALFFLLDPFLKLVFFSNPDQPILVSQVFDQKPLSYLNEWLKLDRDMVLDYSKAALYLPLLIVFFQLINSSINFLLNYEKESLGIVFAQNYRVRTVGNIFRQDYIQLSKKSPSEWMSVAMNDVRYLQGRLTDILSFFLQDMSRGLVCLFGLFWISPIAGTVLGLFLFVLVFMSLKNSKKVEDIATSFQDAQAKIARTSTEAQESFLFMKVHRGESWLHAFFDKASYRYFLLKNKIIFIRCFLGPFVEFCGIALLALFILLRSKSLVVVDATLIAQFFFCFGLLLKPIRSVGTQVVHYKEMIGVLKNSITLDRALSNRDLRPKGERKHASTKIFHVDELSFSWDEKKSMTLKNLNCEPGKVVSLKGTSGVGKSSLMKVLAGILPPRSWKSQVGYQDFIDLVSYLPQSSFMFEGDLYENIFYPKALGTAALVTEEKFETLMEMTALDQELDSVQYSKKIYPRSSHFSGGQIQRICMMRALARGKKIVLMDEPTSALNLSLAKKIMTRLKSLAVEHNLFVLVITHSEEFEDYFDTSYELSGC